MNILFIGDVSGGIGREMLSKHCGRLKEEYHIDFCIANGENASHGKGLSLSCAESLYRSGVDYITMGNHTWNNSSIMTFLSDYRIVRPANFSRNLPGRGFAIAECAKGKVGILNLQGRTFMDPSDNPFSCAVDCILEMREETPVIILDFHGEATSEKYAMAYYLDGMVSAVLGTHTHVQTADERIFPGGTAYLSDVGMTGPADGVIGMNPKLVLKKFVDCVPVRFEPAKGRGQVNAVVVEVDECSGVASRIQRIQFFDP